MASSNNARIHCKVTHALLPLLLLACLPLSTAQHVFHNATDALEGWDDLAKDAGYFTQKGRWKGGLPRRHRSTDYEAFACDRAHPDAGFCLEWSGNSASEVESGDRSSEELCNCTMHDDLFCQSWECRSDRGAPCTDISLRCLGHNDLRITSCTCDEGGNRQNPFCQQWSCIEYSIYGAHEMQSFVCLHEDTSQNYCFRWKGNMSADGYVKSSVCDCYSRSEDRCDLWLCEARKIERCAVLKHGMCDTGFAVGVYGGLGLVFLLGIMTWALVIWMNDSTRSMEALMVFLIGFCVAVLPWMIGVALTGGVYGIGWVFLLWLGPVFLVALYFMSTATSFGMKWNRWKPGSEA